MYYSDHIQVSIYDGEGGLKKEYIESQSFGRWLDDTTKKAGNVLSYVAPNLFGN